MLSNKRIRRISARQARYFKDKAQILIYAEGAKDELGYSTPGYSAGAEFACSFNEVTPREVMGETQVESIAAEARVPDGTVVNSLDRFRLTNRLGETLAASREYAIVGQMERGPFGFILKLGYVTDGS